MRNFFAQYIPSSDHKHLKQTLANVCAQLIAMSAQFVLLYVLINRLGQHGYGQYSLILTLFSLGAIAIGGGTVQAYSRLLLLHKEHETNTRELLGSGLILFSIQAILLSILAYVAIPLLRYIYPDQEFLTTFGQSIFWGGLAVFPLWFLFTTRNLNHIYAQAAYTALIPVLYTGTILLWTSSTTPAPYLMISYVLPLLGSLIYIAFKRPRFRHIMTWITLMNKEWKSFGRHLYIAHIFERITFSLDKLMLGALSFGAITIYEFAQKLTQPISLVSTKYTTSVFSSLTDHPNIPKRIITANIIWWIISTLGMMIIAPVITYVFLPSAMNITLLILPLFALSVLCSNLYTLYYSFLYTKGIAKGMKRYFILRACINLTGNIIAIPLFGIFGAVCTTLFSNLAFMISMRKLYVQHIKSSV
jgi:O-antigen/teichoic acid export membrane protein